MIIITYRYHEFKINDRLFWTLFAHNKLDKSSLRASLYMGLSLNNDLFCVLVVRNYIM